MSQQVLDFMHSHPLFSQTRPALVPQVMPMQVPVRSLFLVTNPSRHKKLVPRPTKIPHPLAELVTKHVRLWSEERPLLENLHRKGVLRLTTARHPVKARREAAGKSVSGIKEHATKTTPTCLSSYLG